MEDFSRFRQERNKTPENVKIIELPDVRFRIVYERHDLAHTPEEVGKPDAYAVEGILSNMSYGTPRAVEEYMQWFWNNRPNFGHLTPEQDEEEKRKQKKLEKYFIDNKIPVYAIDMADPNRLLVRHFRAEDNIKTLEAAVGAAAGTYVAAKAIQATATKKISRRNFLKGFAAAAVAVKTVPQLVDKGFEDTHLSKNTHVQYSTPEKVFRSMQEVINPETERATLTLRNALWAQKLHYITERVRGDLQNKKISKKPEIGIQVGSAHSGLENMLQLPTEERLQKIREIMTALKNNTALGDTPHGIEFDGVARTEFSSLKKQWVVTNDTEEPKIRAIVKQLNFR